VLNVAALVGRLTADPEIRHTASGIPVTSFTIAVTRSFVRAGEERQTDFIDAVVWRNTAEFVCRYFKKGNLIAIEGAIQTGTYNDKDGNKRKTFEIAVSNVHFVESKKDSTENGEAVAGSGNAVYSSGGDSDFRELQSDEDLPF
jgi:single-strand DNA-binding protein